MIAPYRCRLAAHMVLINDMWYQFFVEISISIDLTKSSVLLEMYYWVLKKTE